MIASSTSLPKAMSSAAVASPMPPRPAPARSSWRSTVYSRYSSECHLQVSSVDSCQHCARQRPLLTAAIAASRWSRVEQPISIVDTAGWEMTKRSPSSVRLPATPSRTSGSSFWARGNVGERSRAPSRWAPRPAWRADGGRSCAQRAASQGTDDDGAHVGGLCLVEQAAIVQPRSAGRHRTAGAGVECVVDDLDRIEELRLRRPAATRRRFADAAEADEACLAGRLELFHRGRHLLRAISMASLSPASWAVSGLWQLEEIDMVAAHALQALFHTARDGAGDIGAMVGGQAAPWCRRRRRASTPSGRGRGYAPIRRSP